jgi:hypothetical protein
MSYRTQEDELLAKEAKEAQAEDVKKAAETRFLSIFHSTPKAVEWQEDIMVGLKKLF